MPSARDSMPLTVSPPFATILHWIFRIAFFMEFVGHGIFGIAGKPAWVPYFGVFGFGAPVAWQLMPVIGAIDITLGVTTLIRPMRALLLYGAFWGLFTATLRPFAGEPIWETLERAGNYGIPLAFLLWSGWPRRRAEWLAKIEPRSPELRNRDLVERVVRISLALLLIGHGAFGAVMQKPMLADQWRALGVGGFGGAAIVPAAGWLDIALGVAVLAHPALWLLAFIAVWKVACELLYPLSGAPVWEFVERGGSYAAPLALIALRAMRRAPDSSAVAPAAQDSATSATA
jgi:hypothetical protein